MAVFSRQSSVVSRQPRLATDNSELKTDNSELTTDNSLLWALKNVSFDACPELCRRVKQGEVVGTLAVARRASAGVPSTELRAAPLWGRTRLRDALASAFRRQETGVRKQASLTPDP